MPENYHICSSRTQFDTKGGYTQLDTKDGYFSQTKYQLTLEQN